MNAHDLGLALHALSAPNAAFILGAGASAPEVPTFGQLPRAIAAYAPFLTAFPAAPVPRSTLRDLMQPVLDQAWRSNDMSEWKAGAMTTASIATILEVLIARAHRRSLPQYQVFSLFSQDASITSYNWDGLALARCPQRVILHPHGIVQPREFGEYGLGGLLDDTQLIDDPDARHWLLPDLIFPGEEDGLELSTVRERVLQLWLNASSAIVVGFSFGLASNVAYDAVWLETFVEAFGRNREAPVHIFSPDASTIRAALSDRMERALNVFAWPVRWDSLSATLIQAMAGTTPLAALRLDSQRLAATLETLRCAEAHAC